MKIISADHVLPVASPPIRDGAVAVSDGFISAIGPVSELLKTYPDARHEKMDGCALIPGFVNCHSHLELTVLRGLLDDLDHDFAAWLIRLTEIRAEVLDDADIADSALAGALEGIKAGVTAFGDIGRWGAAGAAALETSGVRGILFQETEFSPGDDAAEEAFSQLEERIAALRERHSGRVEIGVSPHSPYTVSGKLFGIIAEAANERGWKVTIHAAESEAEQQLMAKGEGFFAGVYERYGVRWSAPGVRAVEHLRNTGILSAAPLLAHCTKADESEIAVIAETGSKVAHCPKSNAKFGHGIAPLVPLLDAGVPVGLGTDSMVSNNLCDMFEEARFAALASRVREGGGRFIFPEEAIRLATLGGATALGMEKSVGTIEPGKSADMVAVSLSEVSRRPVNDVAAALLFASSASDVRMTMVGGEILYKDGKCLTVDEERLSARLDEIGAKLADFAR